MTKRYHALIGAAAFAILAAGLAMHLALLPQGRWFDEYFTFSFLRSWGFNGSLFRLRHWGLRPVSELLVYGYWLLVQATGRPLMTPVLGFSWAILFAFLLAAIRPWRMPGRGARWALVLGLPVLFLLAAPVCELWYWPLGALAYLPALGAACLATVAIAGPGLTGFWAWIGVAAALTIGAFSAELGALLALSLAPLLVAGALLGRENDPRPAVSMMVPFAAACLVMVSLAHGRAADPSEMVDAGTFHRMLPSLAAALPHLAAGVLGWGDTVGDTVRAMSARILLATASWAALRGAWPAPVVRARVAMLLTALLATALLSLAGAFYQFGVLCCERHEAYRQALYLLMVVASAGLLPRGGRWPAWIDRPTLAPVVLAAAVLVGAPPRVAALLAEYRLAPAHEAARRAMFRSGADKGSDTLQLTAITPGPLLRGDPIAPGTYSMTPAPAWFVQGPMLFFGKTKMVVRSAR